MYKKIKNAAAFLLVFLLILSLLPAALAADGAQGLDLCDGGAECPLSGFADLDPSAWYHDGVHYCVAAGLMQGDGGMFDPNAALTRSQLAAILWRLEGSPAVNDAMDFEDVPRDAWYAGAVRWAASEGIVQGGGDGRFAPEVPVTRQELAVMLYRYVQSKGCDVSEGGGYQYPLV